MRDDYARMVDLANEGARELGYPDVGAMWRSKYDMDPDAFATELERLWGQVAPLYEALHCHVRARLADTYGGEVVPAGEPIPAHLLGNMWSQSWGNVFELVAPEQAAPAYDLTEILLREEIDPIEMVRYGERFFSSLGFDPLPETFWERSLFVKPADREVVCHASAWDVDQVEDLRIKMCIQQNAEDFQTIHHELGHNYYQRAYNQLPLLYRGSANDGFHEAVGDTIALSVTPPYLVEIGLLEEEPPAEQDIALLMRDALDKVAFLPFGLLVDQWRWQVFSGEVPASDYNQAWWRLRERYQGIQPPVDRSEASFDPGAKYHIPGNTPYTRYFLAHVLQFQFHRALCDTAGYEGPLNRCTIYGSQAAGEKLEEMLAMGQSRPWPDALEAVAGTRQMDAGALIDYFAPLKTWLDEQNRGAFHGLDDEIEGEHVCRLFAAAGQCQQQRGAEGNHRADERDELEEPGQHTKDQRQLHTDQPQPEAHGEADDRHRERLAEQPPLQHPADGEQQFGGAPAASRRHQPDQPPEVRARLGRQVDTREENHDESDTRAHDAVRHRSRLRDDLTVRRVG
jgi:peptidyl-dipeptidase A